MAFGPELIAKLGMDSSAFHRGLDRANSGVMRLKSLFQTGGAGAFFGRFVGVAALVRGFTDIVKHARDARDATAAMGKNVDASTASVARFADTIVAAVNWVKQNGRDLGAGILGLFTMAGERLGNRIAGRDDNAEDRANKIAIEADANAKRLSSPEAKEAAKRRGEDRRQKADAEQKSAADLVQEANERYAELALEQLSTSEQIAALEKRKAEYQRTFVSETAPLLERAKAYNEISKVSEKIDRARQKLADETAAAAERQAQAFEQVAAHQQRVADLERDARDAGAGVEAAREALSAAIADRTSVSIGDAARGLGVNPSSKATARRILSLEQRATRIRQMGEVGEGNRPLDFRDPSGNRLPPGQYAEQLTRLALQLRKNAGFLPTAEREPVAGQLEALTRSEQHLQAIRAALTEEAGP